MTKDFKTWIRAGWLTDPLLDDRDVILFPEKIDGKFVHDAPAAGMDRRRRTAPSTPAPGSPWPTT